MIGRILILEKQDKSFHPYNIYENEKEIWKPNYFPVFLQPNPLLDLSTENRAIWRVCGTGPRLWRCTISKRQFGLAHFWEKLHGRLWVRGELRRKREWKWKRNDKKQREAHGDRHYQTKSSSRGQSRNLNTETPQSWTVKGNKLARLGWNTPSCYCLHSILYDLDFIFK